MKKIILLIVLLLSGCSFEEKLTIDFSYVHFFYGENNEKWHYEFFSNEAINTNSFSLGKDESSKLERVKFEDYGITSLIGGDGVRLHYSGEIWTTCLGPAGDSSIFGELYDIEYYPSEIYEVTLNKEVIEGDQIFISFDTSLENFDLENYYVISLEDNKYIKKDISEYEDGFTFYYSFNTLMTNPHKYSFLYDYKVR